MSRLSKLQLLAVSAVFLGLFAGSSYAQSMTSEVPDHDASSTKAQDSESTVWVVEYLRSHPELLSEVKRAVTQRLREQGNAVQEDAVSDKMLLDRITKDEELQKVAIQYLESRGYVNDGARQAEHTPDKSRFTDAETNFDDEQNRRPLVRRSLTAASSENVTESQSKYLPEDSDQVGTGSSERLGRADNEVVDPKRSRASSDRAEDETRTVKRPSAYFNLPSFRDLYSQLPETSSKLVRFGSDTFRRGTDISKVTMDLPVGPDYVLGPGDGLNVDIWGGLSQRLSRTVDREGRLALPEAGPVVVAGLTLAQAQKLIQNALAPQFRDLKVDISVARVRTVRVYVVGDVQRPGPYDISSVSTPLNALYAAGGPTAGGSMRTVRQFRGKQLIHEVDLYELLLRGLRSDVERLQSGDTILVPPVGSQVSVSGMVRRPAIYELKDEHTLAEVVDLAGGVLVTAALKNITVERVQAHDQHVLLSVNLPPKEEDNVGKKAMEVFEVQDGDNVRISPILPYSEKTVYLQGHVARPGKYSYKDGLTITDLIRSYQDVLPEPSTHAEIVRLKAPDYRPETIEFNLGDVLSGDDPVELKPFDTIRIFGRYEIDPPLVHIYGQVLRPGQYPLAEGMTAAALVRMAGGLKRSSYRDTADVSSYRFDGRQVAIEHRTFPLLKALDGEKAADLVLKPGDVVTVRELPGWKDIGAAVTLNGEVTYAGTYGIEEGERLSSALKRAGGFRPSAYPAAAIFERVEVKQLAQKSRDEMIRRIESSGPNAKFAASSSGQDQAAMMQAMMQQQQQVLTRLRNQPVVGRVVINISADISSWENTSADIELRAGDVVTFPKRPQSVLISGQVYNSSALAHVPGKTAGWYLSQAGGATDMANKKDVYIVRANGSVVSKGSGRFSGNVLSKKMQPGDVLIVPEKIVGGSAVWKNVLTTAQFVSSVAFAAAALGNL